MTVRLRFSATVHAEEDGTNWAEVKELPGGFASGHDRQELEEALLEAIQLCLPDGVTIEGAKVERLDDAEFLVVA